MFVSLLTWLVLVVLWSSCRYKLPSFALELFYLATKARDFHYIQLNKAKKRFPFVYTYAGWFPVLLLIIEEGFEKLWAVVFFIYEKNDGINNDPVNHCWPLVWTIVLYYYYIQWQLRIRAINRIQLCKTHSV